MFSSCQLLCVTRTLCSPSGYRAQVEVCTINPKTIPSSQCSGIVFLIFPQSQKTVCLVRVSTGTTFTVVCSGCCAIDCNESGHLVTWWQLEVCACCNLLVLFVGADWLAAVSGGAIFNDHCKWPRTCVSEAFPPWAVLPGMQGADLGTGAPLGRRGGSAGGRVSCPLSSCSCCPMVWKGIISVVYTSLSKTFCLILYSVLHNNEQNFFVLIVAI